MSEILSYVTKEHYVEIIQVKRWNEEYAKDWTMKFWAGKLFKWYERKRGWVVSIRNKVGSGTRQKYFKNQKEAITFVEEEYGV